MPIHRHSQNRPGRGVLESLMMKCTRCGTANSSGSSFCGDCGEPMPSAGGSGAGGSGAGGSGERGDAKSTKPSDRIVVSRDTQGEVSVKVVRKDGRYLRMECPFCGSSVKVREDRSACPKCGGALPGAGEEIAASEPAIANPTPRDTSLPLAVLYHLRPSGEETQIPLESRQSIVGRLQGIPESLIFKQDPYLSPVHAEFHYTKDGLKVVDRDSLNGVFGQIRGPTSIEDGQTILIGEQVLRFDVLAAGTSTGRSGPDGTVPLGSGLERPGARLVKILADGGDGPDFHVGGQRRIFGRQSGHFSFPDDLLMSKRHAMVEEVGGRYILTDLESTNGTMVRVPDAVLGPGAVVRMGSQRFRVEYRR